MVTRTTPNKFIGRPARANCAVLICPVLSAMAFEGEATGNVKPKLAANVTAIVSCSGLSPIFTANGAAMGISSAAVAALLMISPTKIARAAMMATATTAGSASRNPKRLSFFCHSRQKKIRIHSIIQLTI